MSLKLKATPMKFDISKMERRKELIKFILSNNTREGK